MTLAGDGIGPEIMSAGLSVLKAVSKKIDFEYELEAKDFGGIAIDKHGHPLPEETLQAVKMLTQSCSLQLVILNTTMQKLDQNKGYLLYEKN